MTNKKVRWYAFLLVLALTVSACGGAGAGPQTTDSGNTSTDSPTVETATEAPAAPTEAAPTEESTPDEGAAEEGASEEGSTEESAGAGEPQTGGQLSTYASSDPGTLDPAVISTYDQGLVAPNVLEGLLRLSPDARTLEPGIAEAYEVSDDGTVWTFHLREGATFHNGDPVTAADFKYSFERVLNPETASPRAWMLQGIAGSEAFQSADAEDVSGIVVVDDQTLEITLSQPLAFFGAMLASPSMAVVPQSAVEEFGEDFGQNVVSAGPFTLGEWNINQDLTLNAFEGYWAERPHLDTVRYRFIGDENTRILEFDAGTLDITWIPPAHWERFTTDAVYEDEIERAETFHTEFFAVNMDNEPLGSNPLVRQAMCYALDRAAVIASLQGRASNAQGLLPPGLLGFDENASLCEYDPERARELMAEAGFADGLPDTFQLLMPPWGNLTAYMQIYQANLQEIGINVELNPQEFGPYTEALDSGEYDIAWIYRVSDYADPDSFYYPLLYSNNIDGGGNLARYTNAGVDEQIQAGRLSVDEAERLDAYGQIDAQYAEDLPYIPLTHNIYVDVHQPHVENYVPSPMDLHLYHRVWISGDTE